MSRRHWLAPALVSTLACVGIAHANNLNGVFTLNQGQFQNLTQDLGDALSYKDMMPAAPLGLTGFDIGVTAVDTHLGNAQGWNQATGSGSNNIVVPGLQVQKGLPFGFDVGLTYSAAPGTNVRVIGGDVSYAIIGGGLLSPALTIRGTYTKMLGVSQMSLNTRSVELSLSKGFVFVTPYVGIGRVRTNAIPHVGGLAPATVNDTKEYVGADFNLGLVNLDLEIDHMGNSMSYGANFGWRL